MRMDGCIFLLHIIMLPFLLCTAVVIYEDREEMSTICILLSTFNTLTTMKFLRELMKFCANRPTNTLTSPRPSKSHLTLNTQIFCFNQAQVKQLSTYHHVRLLQHGSLCHPPTHMGCLSCKIFLAIIFTTVCIIIVSGQETLLAPLPSDVRTGNGK